MNPRIRWGIIATGNIAGQFARDLALLPDHEIVAVGSRTMERATAFAAEHGIGRAYDNYPAVAEDPDVDIIYIATPHTDHLPTARHALLNGTAVLCEKPFTVNAREARELIALAEEKGLFLMEAMWMRCNPLHLRVRELVESGAIGEPRAVQADLGFVAAYEPEGRLFAPDLAGGALLDVGVYPVSLAHHLLGAPQSVAATGTLAPTGVDASVGISLSYANGAVASLATSITGTLPNAASVAGTDGWIELPPEFQHTDRLVIHRPDKEPETFSVSLVGVGYTYEAVEVARCLRAGETQSPLVPWADTLAVMEVLDTVRQQIGVRYPSDDAA